MTLIPSPTMCKLYPIKIRVSREGAIVAPIDPTALLHLDIDADVV